MTATNIICSQRHRSITVVADAAIYGKDGTVFAFGPKVRSIAHWPGIVTGRGNSFTIDDVARELAWKFQSFDDLIAGVEAALPAILDQYPFRNDVELVFAGWSAERGEPESYVIHPTECDPRGGITREEVEKAGGVFPTAMRLARLPDAVVGPLLTDEAMKIAAGYIGIDHEWAPSRVRLALRAAVELQRHAEFDIGAGKLRYVGGYCTLTTITPDAISESIFCRWPEDRVGQKLNPAPVDWKLFRKQHLQLVA